MDSSQDKLEPKVETESCSKGTTTDKNSITGAEGSTEKKDNRVEEQDDSAVTMLDVLQDEKDLEEDVAAVLGGADEKHCTYMTGGYMKRQPLYSCLTCIPVEPDDAKRGGVCLACSYQCHEGHELVELYTKRNFRCDCGNPTFADKECKLEKKANLNDANKYNQNFKGVYCICRRPYPDPEDPVMDEMIQCILCEDWFHGRHLSLPDKPPSGDAYSEMICIDCVKAHTFLLSYEGNSVTLVKKDNEDDPSEILSVTLNDSTATDPNLSIDEGPGTSKGARCPLQHRTSDQQRDAKTMFMVGEWRKELCKCPGCVKLYQEENVSFLIDPEDTVHHYESQSKKGESQYEEGMKALSEMDRVKQNEAIQSYNEMKGNLMEYLKKFAASKKVVRQEDIAEFFEQMKSSKRQKVEIPKFCR